MAAPKGHKKLPAGVRCRCIKLWQDGDDFYCCNVGATVDAFGNATGNDDLDRRIRDLRKPE